MAQDYYSKSQIVEIFGLEESFLDRLEAEDLVCSSELEPMVERVFYVDQVERIRIICNLMEDLEVNLPGVEVILGMRENMIRMQRQFDEILEALIKELKTRIR